jgi:hypothetical protein
MMLSRTMQGNPTLQTTEGNKKKTKTTTSINQRLTATQNNEHKGNILTEIDNKQTLRIYHQNIRGAKKYGSWEEWRQGVKWLSAKKVGIATLVETNTKWNNTNKADAQQNAKKETNNAIVTATSSKEKREGDYQPGGTACVLLDNWTGYNTEKIEDKTGLGRWSGFKIKGKSNRTIIILSAYRPTISYDLADYTSYSQQWRLIREEEECDPKPIERFVSDLIEQINKWESLHYDVIVGIDMNEDILTKNSNVQKLIRNTTLTTLVDTEDAPNTYARGSKCIDFILGTRNIGSNIRSQGYLAFYSGGWESDHRGIFVDIDIKGMFGTNTTTPTNEGRILKSTNWMVAKKFINLLGKDIKLELIDGQVKELLKLKFLTKDQKIQLDMLDLQFTKLLIEIEKKCKSEKDTYWSDTLHHAKIINKYWRIKAKGKTNNIQTHHVIMKLIDDLPDKTVIWQGDVNRPIKNQLKRSADKLTEIRNNDWEHRTDFLLRLHNKHLVMNEEKKAKSIRSILRAETKLRCGRIFKAINKPRGANGGLTHIVINNGKEDKIIDDPKDMENLLRKRNVIHFAQAKDTPCMVGEIGKLMNKNGLSVTVKNALKGEIDNNCEVATKEVLSQLKQVRTTTTYRMPLEDMVRGFSIWRESTTTSPSGKHLGIYRTLTKMYKGKYDNIKEKKGENNCVRKCNKQKETATTALIIQNNLINLAIKHCLTYTRWKCIHNLFIEKQVGKPLLNKLRVIHIYEADWNIIAKFFVSHKIHSVACKEGTTMCEQTGGRPGKSASHSATTAILTNDIVCLQKLTGARLYNDAAACFDRIIENISNATLLREGLHPKICKLHAQTLTSARYHIKTNNGISANPNGDGLPEPFLGTGQGAADSMPRWALLSDLIIRMYNAKAKSIKIHSPLSRTEVLTLIKAFVDDTHSTMIGKSIDQIKEYLWHNATLWEKLLHTIGGKLEISKCKFYVYNWTPDEIGTPVLNNQLSFGDISITESESKQKIKIMEIKTDETYKLLGVQNSPLKAAESNADMLEEKKNRLLKLTKLINIPQQEIITCWKTIIMPTMIYGISAMYISKKEYERIQNPLTNSIIPKIGYNRHTPLALVYATKKVGGIGLSRLYTEQGLAQIQFVIGGWRIRNEDTTIIRALLESFIVVSGIPNNPLEDTRVLTYVTTNWINSIKEFLKYINGFIKILDLQTFQQWRAKDTTIMEGAMRYTSEKQKLMAINNCRIYMEVFTIAEISNIDGTHILREAYFGQNDINGNKLLNRHSRSIIKWPEQTRPPAKAWRIWQKFLRSFLKSKSLALKIGMGRWLQNKKPNRIWYKTDSNQIIIDLIPITREPWRGINIVEQQKNRREEIRVIESIDIHITFISTIIDQKPTYAWMVWDINGVIKTKKMYINNGTLIKPERLNLIALYECIMWNIKCFEKWNTTPINNIMTIHTPTVKAANQLKRMRYESETMYKLVKNNADVISDIKHCMEKFGKFKVIVPINKEKGKDNNIDGIKEIEAILTNTTLDTLIGPSPYTSSITLYIDNIPILRDTQENIRSKAAESEYLQYISSKYGWETQQTKLVDWEALATATTKSSSRQAKFITKLTHGWLPTRGHPGYISEDCPTKICPCCNAQIETNIHCIKCKDNKSNTTQQLIDKIRYMNPNVGIQQEMCRILENMLEDKTIMIENGYEDIQCEQNILGVEQMIYGRMSKKWSETYNKETNSNNGCKWVGTIIKTIWEHVQERWQARCEIAAEESETKSKLNNQIMDNQIRNIYSQKQDLDNIDKKLLSKPVESTIRLKLFQKKEWIKRMKIMVKLGVKRHEKQTKRSNHSIRKYFRTIPGNYRNANTIEDEVNITPNSEENGNTEKCRNENWKPP